MNNPEYAKIGDRKYKINTDYRTAIKCNEIANDTTIGDCERALAIIYVLFGEEGLNCPSDYQKLLEIAQKYLSCGKELNDNGNEKPDMDFVQDMDFIEASFMSDYGIDLANIEMHWWKFFNLMNGLSNSEFGNCCILNRIRNIRNTDLNSIEDAKTRKQVKEQQERFALKKMKKKFTKEQEKSIDKFYKLTGIVR